MNTLSFHVDIVPPTATAQQKGACVRGGHVWFFEKSNVRSARETLMAAFRPHVPDAPFAGPCILHVKLAFPFRRSELKSVVRVGRDIPHTSRPDLDNLEKMLLDVMTAMRFWTDDALVFEKHTSKVWGPVPGITVSIRSEEQQ